MGIGPKFVHPTAQLGTPLLLVGRSGLIEPPHVGPPKATLLWAGDIFGRIRVGVMMAMIGYPTRRKTAVLNIAQPLLNIAQPLLNIAQKIRKCSTNLLSWSVRCASRR